MSYILQTSEFSTCSNCGKAVEILADREDQVDYPRFYICHPCKIVAQIGVGVVPKGLSLSETLDRVLIRIEKIKIDP